MPYQSKTDCSCGGDPMPSICHSNPSGQLCRTVVSGLPDGCFSTGDLAETVLYVFEENIQQRPGSRGWTVSQVNDLRDKVRIFQMDNYLLEIDIGFCTPDWGICVVTDPRTGNDLILFPEYADESRFYLIPEVVLQYLDWVLLHELGHAWQKRNYGVDESSMAEYLRTPKGDAVERILLGFANTDFEYSAPPLGRYVLAKRQEASWAKFLHSNPEEEIALVTAALDVHADARSIREGTDESLAQFLYFNTLLACLVNLRIKAGYTLPVAFLSRVSANLGFFVSRYEEVGHVVPAALEKMNRTPSETFGVYVKSLSRDAIVAELATSVSENAAACLDNEVGAAESYRYLCDTFQEYLELGSRRTALSYATLAHLDRYLNAEEDSSLRSSASKYLSETHSAKALQILLDRFRKEKDRHVVEELRFSIIHLLGTLAPANSVQIIRELLQHFEVGSVVNSLFELGRIGDFAPDEVCKLMEELIDQDPMTMLFGLRWTIGYVSKRNLEKALQMAKRLRGKMDLTCQEIGMNCLGRIGIYHPEAAIHELERELKKIDDDFLLRAASVAFGEILYWSPTSALEMVKRGLASVDDRVRSNTGYLFAYGTEIRYVARIINELGMWIAGTDETLQRGAAIALGFVGRKFPHDVLHVLVKFLKEKVAADVHPLGVGPVVSDAAGAVGIVGRAHFEEFLAAISHLQDSKQWREQAAAAMAIASAGIERPELAIGEINKMIHASSFLGSCVVGMALGNIGNHHPKLVVQAIRIHMNSSSFEVLLAMSSALMMMRQRQPEHAEPLLKEMCNSDNPVIKNVAETALSMVNGRPIPQF